MTDKIDITNMLLARASAAQKLASEHLDEEQYEQAVTQWEIASALSEAAVEVLRMAREGE